MAAYIYSILVNHPVSTTTDLVPNHLLSHCYRIKFFRSKVKSGSYAIDAEKDDSDASFMKEDDKKQVELCVAKIVFKCIRNYGTAILHANYLIHHVSKPGIA